MQSTIEKYAKGADERNLAALKLAFHENFHVVAITKDGIKSMNKETYLKLIQEGKIGGSKRSVEITFSDDDGTIGTAKVLLKSDTVIFHDHLTLIKENGSWFIVSNVTQASPR